GPWSQLRASAPWDRRYLERQERSSDLEVAGFLTADQATPLIASASPLKTARLFELPQSRTNPRRERPPLLRSKAEGVRTPRLLRLPGTAYLRQRSYSESSPQSPRQGSEERSPPVDQSRSHPMPP